MSSKNVHSGRGSREVWADYDEQTIVVYQAFSDEIADSALAAGRFVGPAFSFGRMTWIKPSFLWMMQRCGWAQKAGQQRVLGVRITRDGWDSALSKAVLTHPDARVYADGGDWSAQAKAAQVRVQWDPERSLRGGKLEHRSIQVGIGRALVREYVDSWIVELSDLTPRVRKIHALLQDGHADKAGAQLPTERRYPLAEATARRLGCS